jgi:cytochrome c oxidase subunit 2
MAFWVVAETPERFRAWLAEQERPAQSPASAAGRRGEQIFLAQACSSCHQVRGTDARGTVGPDLTHVAARSSLAALTIPNTPKALAEWIGDPQHVKPGNRMPGLNLSREQVRDLVAFLRELR